MKALTPAKRARATARLAALCARLYSPATSREKRRDLSLQVSMLRAQLSGCSDLLGSMQRASGSDDDEATDD